MALTLLQIVQRAARRLPVSSQIASVIGSADPLAEQMLEMLQEEGDELVERHEWPALLTNWSFTIGDGDPYAVDYPVDYGRKRVGAEFWRSASNLTPLLGPVDPYTWRLLLTTPSPYPGYWRRFGDGIEITGVSEGETVSTEYVSKYWVTNVNQQNQPLLSNDGDVPRLPDNILAHGLVWRWKQSKGMEYAEDMLTYERALSRRIWEDTAAGTISTTPTEQYPGAKIGWPITITPIS